MILPIIADAIEAAKREGKCRPLRFMEKELRKIGYVLSQEEEEALDDASTNGGRKPNRNEQGFTPNQNKLADGFELYWRCIRDEGMRRDDAFARVCKELNIKPSVLHDVILKLRKDVNAVLRARGLI